MKHRVGPDGPSEAGTCGALEVGGEQEHRAWSIEHRVEGARHKARGRLEATTMELHWFSWLG